VRKAGKAPGILMTDPVQAQIYLDAGALFVAVGVDTLLLVAAARGLVQKFKKPGSAAALKPGY
jgi:4-hydroxy-2-oxoheptanedioate aldolase